MLKLIIMMMMLMITIKKRHSKDSPALAHKAPIDLQGISLGPRVEDQGRAGKKT